ncbi:MAG: zinc ABC transporter permease subunit ZnuB [Magnetococcus sp. DMHC-6]
MFEDFFWRAILAGIGTAMAAGPLGCFIVWRRMAYFGDTMSHSALLGVALGVLMEINPVWGVMGVTTLLAIFLVFLEQRQWISGDTWLGILSHSALSLGLVVLSLMVWLRLDIMGYLFGDILAVGIEDLYWVYGGGILVLSVLGLIWRPLLALTVHEDLARAEGIPTLKIRFIFMLLIAVVIAIAMRIVGILLITSLLIIPAATARRWVHSPEAMALGAMGAGVLSVFMGLWASLTIDTPSGPSIVLAGTVLFTISHLWPNKNGVNQNH